MILADTSVWIDHFRSTDATLKALLEEGRVLIHPYVVGEIACGNLPRRTEVLGTLDRLPAAAVARDREVRGLIERQDLYGRGIGFVDFHLLAATALSDASLWTFDRRLAGAADALGIGFSGPAVH